MATLLLIAEHPEWPAGMPAVVAQSCLDQIEMLQKPLVDLLPGYRNLQDELESYGGTDE